jgi:hypothetical protein
MAEQQQKQAEEPKNFTSFKPASLSPEEVKEAAKKSGWKDNKEQVEKEGKEFIDADEFVRRGELLKTISKQAKALKQIRQELDARSEQDAHFQKVHKQKVQEAYENAVVDLKAQKLAHIKAGDHEQAAEVEDKLDELKVAKEKEDKTPAPEAKKVPKEAQTWLDDERNDWYHQDEDLAAAFEGILSKVIRDNKGMPLAEAFEKAEARFAKKHPEVYAQVEEEDEEEEEQPKKAVSKVSGASRTVKKDSNKPKFTWADLPSDIIPIAQSFIDNGTFKTRQAYVDRYFAKFGKE